MKSRKETNKKQQSKPISQEALAVMIQRGFAGVDERLDDIDEEMKGLKRGIETKFDMISGYFDEHDLEALDDSVLDHYVRIENLESDIKKIKRKLEIS